MECDDTTVVKVACRDTRVDPSPLPAASCVAHRRGELGGALRSQATGPIPSIRCKSSSPSLRGRERVVYLSFDADAHGGQLCVSNGWASAKCGREPLVLPVLFDRVVEIDAAESAPQVMRRRKRSNVRGDADAARAVHTSHPSTQPRYSSCCTSENQKYQLNSESTFLFPSLTTFSLSPSRNVSKEVYRSRGVHKAFFDVEPG
jgi:hypothetical protein